MNFLENEFFLLAVTFGIFFLAKLLQKKTGIMLLNPILLTIAILIVFLKMTHISYETYNEGGHLIEFWLKPAVVALGVPLYLQLETIKKQLLPIMLSQLAGCIVGVISVVLIAKLMGASDEIIYSLAPKSVTTPIAMEVTKSLGRHSLTYRRRSGLRGSTGRNTGLQDHEIDTHRQSHGTRPFLGSRRPRGRNFHSHGHQPQIRCIRQPRPDPERYLHSIVDPDYSAIIRATLTKSSYFCYL